MPGKKISPLYRIIKALVRLFYGKTRVVGAENLPDAPCIVVGNHCQMNGPIAGELHFPGPHYIWCAGEMMHLSDVPAYAYKDFWSQKPKAVRWLYRIASYLIAPLAVYSGWVASSASVVCACAGSAARAMAIAHVAGASVLII